MDRERKNIIIQEIHFWKENKMLPEHYCNYLLALYTKGENDPQEKKRSSYYNQRHTWISIGLLLMIIVMLFVTYLDKVFFSWQIVISLTFFLILTSVNTYFRKKQMNASIVYLTAAFLLLLFSVQLNQKFWNGDALSLYFLLLINSFIWLLGGFWTKMWLLIAIGLVTLLLLLILIIRPYV